MLILGTQVFYIFLGLKLALANLGLGYCKFNHCGVIVDYMNERAF